MAVPSIDQMRVYGNTLKRLSDNVKNQAGGMKLGVTLNRHIEDLVKHIDQYPLLTNTRYCLTQSPTDDSKWNVLKHDGMHWVEVKVLYSDRPIEFGSRAEAIEHIRTLSGD